MKIRKELAKGSTPLLVLGVLSRGEMYGYQIIKTVELESRQVFQMNEGTLYPILHALEKDGALRSYEKQTPAGKTRRYYTLTRAGEDRLNERETQWRQFTGAVERVLRAEPSQA